LEYEIYGRSKTTWKVWGSKFHARVIKDLSGIHIEVYNLALLPKDLFIKELYNTFTKYTSASQLAVDSFVKVFHALRKGDMRFSGERTMRIENPGIRCPAGGAPLITADKACSKCGASNSPERLLHKVRQVTELTNIFIALQLMMTALGHSGEDKGDTGPDSQDPD
jgi:hypothetical protein